VWGGGGRALASAPAIALSERHAAAPGKPYWSRSFGLGTVICTLKRFFMFS
jgi:hypothetical protein